MALKSIPDVRKHILGVMAEAVDRFIPEFAEETGRFHSDLEGPAAEGETVRFGWRDK